MRSIYKIILLLSIMGSLSACKKFLDVKPDKKQVIPVSLEDCQALLNNITILQQGTSVAEISSDDYYLTDDNLNSLDPRFSEPYYWKSDANLFSTEWSGPYNHILIANQVLATLNNLNPAQNPQTYSKIKGTALMIRAFNYSLLVQLFCQPYEKSTAGTDMGIPIRLSPSIDEKTERGTLQQVYDRIIQDYNDAANLLPAEQPNTGIMKSVASPVKAAAYAGLARVYLDMRDYTKAYENADASLNLYSTLMDFKNIDQTPYYPIPRYNAEVLYEMNGPGFVPLIFGLVSPELYNLYPSGDLRKVLFFIDLGDGTYNFKGTYNEGELFQGFATDELYLIRAECAARKADVTTALRDLNTLRKNRWDNTFTPSTASNADEALHLIITERRKELPFRGLRWSDLRRLNKESAFAKTLQRTVNGQVHTLSPNDLRYTQLIPSDVLQRVNIPQNPR